MYNTKKPQIFANIKQHKCKIHEAQINKNYNRQHDEVLISICGFLLGIEYMMLMTMIILMTTPISNNFIHKYNIYLDWQLCLCVWKQAEETHFYVKLLIRFG